MERRVKLIVAVCLLVVAAGVAAWSLARGERVDASVNTHAEEISAQLRAGEAPPPGPTLPPPGPRGPRRAE